MPDGTAAPPSGAPWQRHELLRIDPAAWSFAIARSPHAAHPLLVAWAERGWPAILRRRQACDVSDLLPVGVPFPPEEGKLRIDLLVPHTAVLCRSPRPPLADTSGAAPADWQEPISGLRALGARHGVEPAPFGSMLWQHLTGLRYLSATSDLDLLWPFDAVCNLAALLEGIAAIEGAAPMRIDGEIAFADGSAVNWRELAEALRDDAAELLVKTSNGASMRPVRGLLAERTR